MDEIIEILSSKLPLELVNKILYQYGGAQSPTAKIIKDHLRKITIYVEDIPYGTAYYAVYEGVIYAGMWGDDLVKSRCKSYTFEWGKTYIHGTRKNVYLTFIDKHHIYVHYTDPIDRPVGLALYQYTLGQFIAFADCNLEPFIRGGVILDPPILIPTPTPPLTPPL